MKADTLAPPKQPHMTQTYGKKKSKTNGATAESKGLDDLADPIVGLSVKVKRGTGSDDLCEALEALDLKPGKQSSQKSLEAASVWISLEDDETEIEAIRLDLEDKILAENEDVGEADTGSRTIQDGDNSRDSDAEMVEDQSPQQPKRVLPY